MRRVVKTDKEVYEDALSKSRSALEFRARADKASDKKRMLNDLGDLLGVCELKELKYLIALAESDKDLPIDGYDWIGDLPHMRDVWYVSESILILINYNYIFKTLCSFFKGRKNIGELVESIIAQACADKILSKFVCMGIRDKGEYIEVFEGNAVSFFIGECRFKMLNVLSGRGEMECEYIEDLGGSNFTGETTDDSDIYESDDEEDRVVESPLMRVIREESVDGGTLDVVVEGDKVLFREICGDIKELEVCGDLVGVSGVLKLRDVVECIIKGGDVVRLKECLGGFKVVKKALKFIIDINSIKI